MIFIGKQCKATAFCDKKHRTLWFSFTQQWKNILLESCLIPAGFKSICAYDKGVDVRR